MARLGGCESHLDATQKIVVKPAPTHIAPNTVKSLVICSTRFPSSQTCRGTSLHRFPSFPSSPY
ncbi:MAG: hypothetical protein RIM23_16835 [Coleofasciculus sp. G3-WIS-01]|uniref:hypothetical protein n=1 Tax=Coleofasciculus sp. G3-WIS-01 TaxID=3069528 RepID=UPI0033000E8B